MTTIKNHMSRASIVTKFQFPVDHGSSDCRKQELVYFRIWMPITTMLIDLYSICRSRTRSGWITIVVYSVSTVQRTAEIRRSTRLTRS